MKLQVLVDNNTYIDSYYFAEPAVSYYIEDEEDKILFDVGYSDVFISNAKKLGVNLQAINKIVLSHGHDDHTGGLAYIEKAVDLSKVSMIAHPELFNKKYFEGEEICTPYSKEEMATKTQLILKKEPYNISEKMIYLGEIPTYHAFENRLDIGEIERNGHLEKDYVLDDSAIAYKSSKGLFIITGCSHSGICNIVEHAKKVCNENKIAGVIGGFHLFDVDERLHETINYLKQQDIQDLYPCHCVSFNAKAEIHRNIPIHEVGVSMTIEI